MEIFGRGSDWLKPITVPERELRPQEERIYPGRTPVDDICPEAKVYWGSLVRSGVGSGYLVGIDVS